VAGLRQGSRLRQDYGETGLKPLELPESGGIRARSRWAQRASRGVPEDRSSFRSQEEFAAARDERSARVAACLKSARVSGVGRDSSPLAMSATRESRRSWRPLDTPTSRS